MVAFILLVVGGLNWLLTAFGWGIGQFTDGISPMLTQAIYIIIGLAAVYELLTHKSTCKNCGTSSSSNASMGMGGM